MAGSQSDQQTAKYAEGALIEISADARSASEDVASLAAYIADMSDELSKLAARGDMPMLAYFLNLARVEAETRARELGGYPIERRRG